MSTSNDTEIPTTKIDITIKDLSYMERKHTGFQLSKGRKYYVKLQLDGKTSQTTVSETASAPSWPNTFEFSTTISSKLVLEVYVSHRVRNDTVIGRMQDTVESLLDQQAVSYILKRAGPVGEKLQSVVTFNVTRLDSGNRMGTDTLVDKAQTTDLIAQAKDDMSQIQPVSFERLLDKSKFFVEFAAGISELHPYAKATFNVLSFAYKMMLAQRDRDEKIQQLVDSLDDLFHFLLYAGGLKDLVLSTSDSYNLTKIQIKNLRLISEQVVECAHFIIGYAQTKSSGHRITKNITLDYDTTVKAYEDKFKEFKSEFTNHSNLVTEITVLQTKFLVQQMLSDVDKIAADNDLNDLVYANGASCSFEKACLPGTRQNIIDEITDWVNKPTDDMSSQLLWLYGVAGCGKSAIAHSIAHRFKALKWLGSSFCFDAANQAARGPHYLFSNITRDLADFDVSWKLSLCNTIKDDKALRKSHSVKSQFDNFLIKPALNLTMVGPVVIVIDALDECGDSASRESILTILGTQLLMLPGNFRFIVTSRPEPDIGHAFQHKTNILCKDMASFDLLQTRKDIEAMILTRLAGPTQKSLERHWPNWQYILVEKADGLFQWAFTACNFIKQQGHLPYQRFQLLIEGLDGSSQLYALYETILKQSFPYQDSEAMKRFQTVMGALLMVKKPLSLSVLNWLCLGQDIEIIESVLLPLGAVLSGVTSDSIPIHILHTSFRDYLLDNTHNKNFCIDADKACQNLTLTCLNIMLKELHFNICKLESSCIMNRDVADIETKLQDYVTDHVSYACTFWADHLEDGGYKYEIEVELEKFMNSQFLYWLEVLSLTKTLNIAIGSLERVVKWTSIYMEGLTALAQDAQAFVVNSWEAISQSAPHIYLSALPFAPEQSLVARVYINEYRNTFLVIKGKAKYWPQLRNVLEGHTSEIVSVAFSPNGKHIASGSLDNTVRIWDAPTGYAIGGPLKGHTGGVSSVAFSPDGKYIASGSDDNTVRTWDTKTGYAIYEPLEGHTQGIISVAFSPDGNYIASGSFDGTIRIWDTNTGHAIGDPLEGHTGGIISVAFSPNGKYIASGSFDNTIRIWDTQIGYVIDKLLTGHTERVHSVAFSPGGNCIASGSFDGTIRIWNTKTGHAIGDPLKGHTGGIASVAFSPDGKYIASGSFDNTVRIWDAETGHAIYEPLEGHTNYIISVAFSPDGKLIASGSLDKTIRIWDARIGHIREGAYGHTSEVGSVAFSPDGKHIASGSYDHTVRIWDAETGHAVGDPLKGHTGGVASVAFSPDGKYIASGSTDGTIRIWDTKTGHTIHEPLEGHRNMVFSVAFSPNGKHIVSGSEDTTVRIWNAETGLPVGRPLEGHLGPVQSVVFSPDSKHIASGSEGKTIIIWDAETGCAVGVPLKGHSMPIQSVAFSPHGQHVASGSEDNSVRIWDIETGHSIGGQLEGHTSMVVSVAFSPDGNYIASGSMDKTIRIWDARTGHIVGGPLEGHTNWITSVVFSPDGKYIASGSLDKTIRVWDAKTSHAGGSLSGEHTGQLVYPPLAPPPGDKHTAASGSPDNKPRVWNTLESTENAMDLTLQNGFLVQDGWAYSHGKILFWVPHFNHNIYSAHPNTLIIGKNPTLVDVTHFVYDTKWENCKTPTLVV